MSLTVLLSILSFSFFTGCSSKDEQRAQYAASQPKYAEPVNVSLQGQVNDAPLAWAAPYFSLSAAGYAFQASAGMEDFVNKLNTQVSNVDFDDVGGKDFIRVFENEFSTRYDKKFNIEAVLNDGATQYIATIEAVGSGSYLDITVVGNPDIYGYDNIIEIPRVRNYHSSSFFTYLFSPGYARYVSPWRVGYYPSFYSIGTPIIALDLYDTRLMGTTYYRRVEPVRVRSTGRAVSSIRTSPTYKRSTSKTALKTASKKPNPYKSTKADSRKLSKSMSKDQGLKKRDVNKKVETGGLVDPNRLETKKAPQGTQKKVGSTSTQKLKSKSTVKKKNPYKKKTQKRKSSSRRKSSKRRR